MSEVIIAQEQDAVNKPIHLSLFKEIEGTLVLTNERLIFACADERGMPLTRKISKDESMGKKIEEEAENLELDWAGLGGPLFYSEIEDLKKISPNPKNLFISLSSISKVSGEKAGLVERPTLKVSWKADETGNVKSTEFQEVLTGRERTKNLNDWASVIEKLKAGALEIQELPNAPPINTLEGKIAYMMGDMQEKGLLEIEGQVEGAFKIDLEPEDVQVACEKLVSIGFLDRPGDTSDPEAEPFYRKCSPIGIDGLSS